MCLKSLFTTTACSVALFAQAIPEPTYTVAITSAPPYSASGELFILKADTNSAALNNPVLVVEGFDIGNSMNWPELYGLLNEENLVADLQSFGRDLAVLNFGDSTADILGNMALNATAIDYVNANRADAADKFVAVGASLGGLTLRKALVDAPNHDVDTWISFDAPHEGANIPLGLQEYLEFFGPQDDAAAEMLAALDSPAARQMLLLHHSHPDGLAGGSLPERPDFVATMAAAGYPTNCKTIAICNGSGFGETYPFNAGERIIHWTDSGGLFDPSIVSDVYSLPAAPATVFSGKITLLFITVDSATVEAYHPLSFDNAPGGARSTFLDLFANLPTSGDDYCTQTNHCFIPTVSALGIPIENIASNLDAHAELLALSPFDEIHYAVTNEPHVQINPRNKRWLMRAVLEDIDTDGDGYDDYEEYLLGTNPASPDSTLNIVAVIEVALVEGSASLAWNAFPNTRYEVWYSPELGEPWQPLETLPPTSDPAILREYAVDGSEASGFFKISANPVDPVDD
ncbi:hypothetical protein PDESU_05611 [Pontiella desulfatans]|uniref:DUF676 domain-containing protein n=1 Tax=Pontiella desulfatans TaxID=2750659 RepID=A0A6C2UBL8_PONDE|nr:hypothetical protein [Pontiella desulfatans]VGO17017.1 hypothetical protein PDESU_05611 [Pontiella desulfatans]